jgi:hypothetical protein
VHEAFGGQIDAGEIYLDDDSVLARERRSWHLSFAETPGVAAECRRIAATCAAGSR